MSTFLDLFIYERVTQAKKASTFHNCRFLKQVGKFKPGDQAAAISIYVDLYIWSSDEEIILL